MPLSIFPVQCKLYKIEEKIEIDQLDRMSQCLLEGGQYKVLPPFWMQTRAWRRIKKTNMASHVREDSFSVKLSLILRIMSSTDRREEKKNFLIQGRRFRRPFKNYCNYRYFMKLYIWFIKPILLKQTCTSFLLTTQFCSTQKRLLNLFNLIAEIFFSLKKCKTYLQNQLNLEVCKDCLLHKLQ